MTNADILLNYTELLISDTSSWHDRRESLQAMHSLFVHVGSFDTNDKNNDTPSLWLPNGYAVSPQSAAMCLFEIARTREFVLGLIEAIRFQLATQEVRPIRVLDAGCGPYALLTALAAQYFSADDVQFHVLDIFEENLRAAEKVIVAFGLGDRFREGIVSDATSYQWHNDKPLHVVVTETMLNSLRKEPQVAVTLNLAPQLAPGGTFVPEHISVHLVQVDTEKERQITQLAMEQEDFGPPNYAAFETDLGVLVTLDKHTTAEAITAPCSSRITIPDDFTTATGILEWHTRIRVFGNHVLERRDTSITMPAAFSGNGRNPLHPGDQLCFWYEMTGEPGIRFKKMEEEKLEA